MLDYGPDGNKYRYKGLYPQKTDFYTYYVYKEGQLIFKYGFNYSGVTLDALQSFAKGYLKFTYTNIDQLFAQLSKVFTIEKNFAVHDYNDIYALIADASNQLRKQWEKDLYEHYGVDPKSHLTKLIMSKAWEDGHSSGFYGVESYFDAYMEFIQDAMVANFKDKNER